MLQLNNAVNQWWLPFKYWILTGLMTKYLFNPHERVIVNVKTKTKKTPGILSDLSEICTSDGYATAFFRSCSSSQMNGYATVWCNCQICKFQSAPTFVNFEMQNSHWNKTFFKKSVHSNFYFIVLLLNCCLSRGWKETLSLI